MTVGERERDPPSKAAKPYDAARLHPPRERRVKHNPCKSEGYLSEREGMHDPIQLRVPAGQCIAEEEGAAAGDPLARLKRRAWLGLTPQSSPSVSGVQLS